MIKVYVVDALGPGQRTSVIVPCTIRSAKIVGSARVNRSSSLKPFVAIDRYFKNASQ